jgi:hypothetical protein
MNTTLYAPQQVFVGEKFPVPNSELLNPITTFAPEVLRIHHLACNLKNGNHVATKE